MERNRWETAIRCLEAAVHPDTRDDAVIAAVNGFRRIAEAVPLSQICLEFACGGVPLAELAAMKESLDHLRHENRALQRKLAVDAAAQSEAAERLDTAHRRIYELTEEAAAAQRLAAAVEREFEDFRAAYARAIDGILRENVAVHQALGDAAQPARPAARPFSPALAEARLGAAKAAAFVGGGNGSGRVLPGGPPPVPAWPA
ncbi:MAG TPA: hypothetical protein VG651_21995 [Stellaceae bacterium]|nr:hypothetical protein [Stellaceae bacterium]